MHTSFRRSAGFDAALRSVGMDSSLFSKNYKQQAVFGESDKWDYKARAAAMDTVRGFLDSQQYAFDAASGSGLAFLASMLELPEVDLVTPLAAVTHARDIPIKSGGGYVEYLSAWASDYSTSGGNQYGLQGTENVDIPMVQTNIIKGIWPALNWQASMRVAFLDLQRLIDAKKQGIPAPYSLQQLLDTGVKLIWNKALDRVTYLGWAGNYGLMNNTAFASNVAVNGAGGSPLWSKKTPVEILNDINTGILYSQENSGYDVEGIPDTALVDYEHWALLNQPMTSGGFNSVLEYVLMNNVARRQGVDFEILPLPDPWISTQGVGSTSEILFYVKKDKSLYLKIPQPIQKVFTVPSVQGGGAYETLFSGCIGVVQVVRPTTGNYIYGV
jgi:hypothetical protein